MRNGILLVDKPKGYTSRDVVNVISKKLKTKKIGHTGTLDPNATGLMIICVNKATGLVELITSEDKEYIATVKLGILTDTLDIKGNILQKNYDYKLDYDKLEETLKLFVGSYLQEVPLYSAIKVNGMRLYDYAYKNKKITLPKRMVTIKEISLISFKKDSFTFKVLVSKGTYIRSLIKDVSDKLGILMTLEDLRRTKIDKYSVLDAKSLDSIGESDIIPVDRFLTLPRISIDGELLKKVLNGVRLQNIYNSEMVMFFYKNELIAIYKNNEHNELCMYKLFKD